MQVIVREEHYYNALKRIAALADVTQTRGPLEHIFTPEHIMEEDGWGPIHPFTKDGLRMAARIAQAALDAPSGVSEELLLMERDV